MSTKMLLSLVLCNAIWATNPVMGKILMETYTPMQTAWLRYASAVVAILVLAAAQRKSSWLPQQVFRRETTGWILLGAVFTFFGSPISQYYGLAQATATTNALVVATEPLIAAIMAWVIIRERVPRMLLVALPVATVGFLFLSGLYRPQAGAGISNESWGALLLLLCIPCEVMFSLSSKKLGLELEPAVSFSWTLLIGFVLFSTYVVTQPGGFPSLTTAISAKAMLAIFWLGPLSTAGAYMYWAYALKEAPVAAVSLSLFVQPLWGSLLGYIMLGERLSLLQSFGGALILVALLLQTNLKKA